MPWRCWARWPDITQPGEPSAATDPNSTYRAIKLLKPGEKPFLAANNYQALSGTGVQPILASGGTDRPLLLMGVNYCPESATDKDGFCADGQGKGRLVAFRTVAQDDPSLSLSCPVESTLSFPTSTSIRYESTGSKPLTGEAIFTATDSAGNAYPKTEYFTIQPGQRRTIPMEVHPIVMGRVTFTARLNLPPDVLKRDKNTGNNERTCTVMVHDCPECDIPQLGSGSVLIRP